MINDTTIGNPFQKSNFGNFKMEMSQLEKVINISPPKCSYRYIGSANKNERGKSPFFTNRRKSGNNLIIENPQKSLTFNRRPKTNLNARRGDSLIKTNKSNIKTLQINGKKFES